MAQVVSRPRVFAHPSRPNNVGQNPSSPVVFAHPSRPNAIAALNQSPFRFNPMPTGTTLSQAYKSLGGFNPTTPSPFATRGTINPSGGFWDSPTGKVLSGTFPVAGSIGKGISDIISGKSDKVAKDALLTVSHGVPGHEALKVQSAIGGTKPAKDLAQFASKAAQKIASNKNVPLVGTGGIGNAGIGSAGISGPSGRGPTLGVAIAHAPPSAVNSVPGQILRNAAGEGIGIFGNAPANLALTVQHPLKTLEQFPKTDPIVQSVTQSIKKGHPVLTPVVKHPVSTALDLGGVEGAIGKTLGVGLRGGAGIYAKAGGTNPRVLKMGSTERPALKLAQGPDKTTTRPQDYSKMQTRKGAQLAGEAIKRKVGRDPYAASSKFIAPKLRQAFELNKRVYDENAMSQSSSLSARPQAQKVIDKAFKGLPKDQHAAVPLFIGRMLRGPATVKEDLLTIRQHMLENPAGPHAEEIQGNTLKTIEGLLNNKKFLAHPEKAYTAAEKIIPDENARQQVLIESKLLKPEEAHAAHILYAVTHMKDVVPAGPEDVHRSQPLFGEGRQVNLTPGSSTAESSVAEQKLRSAEHDLGKVKAHTPDDTEAIHAAQTRVATAQRRFQDQPKAVSASHEVTVKLQGPRAGGERKGAPYFLKNAKTGQEITPEMVKAHMAANGVPEPGFFSQKINQPNQYYKQAMPKGKPLLRGRFKRRSGEATVGGTFDLANPKEMLKRQAAGSQSLASAGRTAQHRVETFAFGKATPTEQGVEPGFYSSYEEAQRAGEVLSQHPTNAGMRFRPIDVGTSSDVHDLLNSNVHPDEQTALALHEKMQQMFSSRGPGRYALVPESVYKRWQELDTPRSTAEKKWANAVRVWKEIRLSTSTKWPFGNLASHTTRAVINRYGPVGITRLRYEKVLKQVEKDYGPRARREAEARFTTGGIFGSQHSVDTYSEPGALLRAPVVKQLADVARFWRDHYMGANEKMEQQFFKPAAGRAMGEDMHGFLKIAGPTIKEYARRLVEEPETIVKAARKQEEYTGRWGKPGVIGKKVQRDFAPFGQWTAVALKFLYYTLPAKHPVKLAVLAALNNIHDKERHKLGIDTSQVPSFMAALIPTHGGKKIIRVGGYSEVGIPAAGLGGIASTASPIYSSIGNAMQGQDPFGNKLPKGSNTAAVALNQALQGFVPGYQQAQTFAAGGLKEKGDSTLWHIKVKPHQGNGSIGKAVNRLWNPVRQVPAGQPKKPKKTVVDLASPHPSTGIGGMRGAFNRATGAITPFAMHSPLQQLKQGTQIAGLDKQLWHGRSGLTYFTRVKGKGWVPGDPTKDNSGKWLRPTTDSKGRTVPARDTKGAVARPAGGFGGGVPGLSSLERQGLDTYLKAHGLPALPAQNKPTTAHTLHDWLTKHNLRIIPNTPLHDWLASKGLMIIHKKTPGSSRAGGRHTHASKGGGGALGLGGGNVGMPRGLGSSSSHAPNPLGTSSGTSLKSLLGSTATPSSVPTGIKALLPTHSVKGLTAASSLPKPPRIPKAPRRRARARV